jgi:hypothetical protein
VKSSWRLNASKIVTGVVAMYAVAMFAIMGFGIVGPLFAGNDSGDFVGISQLSSNRGVALLTGKDEKPHRVDFPTLIPGSSTIEAGQWALELLRSI